MKRQSNNMIIFVVGGIGVLLLIAGTIASVLETGAFGLKTSINGIEDNSTTKTTSSKYIT